MKTEARCARQRRPQTGLLFLHLKHFLLREHQHEGEHRAEDVGRRA